MTLHVLRTSRPFLAMFAVMALSACTTTLADAPKHSMKDGISMSSCPCCAKMGEQSNAGNKKLGCCSDMMDGKGNCGGCCGGGDGKPMMCQPKN